MNKKTKKGFTIVELVIVIAVIAILAAVLIPTFSGVIEKAKVSNDVALVKNINTVLATEEIGNAKPATMTDALAMAQKGGYTVEKLTPRSTGEILWNSKTNRFMLVKGDDVVFGDKAGAADVDIWQIASELPNPAKYSIYAKSDWEDPTVDDLKEGFDAGEANITSISYVGNGTPQTVVIRTNSASTTLKINVYENGSECDTVNHYGVVGKIEAVNVGMSSYHENGKAYFVELQKGKIVAENESQISVLYAKSENVAVVENGGSIANAYATTDLNAANTANGGNVTLGVATEDTITSKGKEAQDQAIEDETVDNQLETDPSIVAYTSDGTQLTYYTSLKAAVEATDNGTINLIKDQELSEVLTISNKNLRIVGKGEVKPVIIGAIKIEHTSGNHAISFENLQFTNNTQKDHLADVSVCSSVEDVNVLTITNCLFYEIETARPDDRAQKSVVAICAASEGGKTGTQLIFKNNIVKTIDYEKKNENAYYNVAITTSGIYDSKSYGNNIYNYAMHEIEGNQFLGHFHSIIAGGYANVANNVFDGKYYNGTTEAVTSRAFQFRGTVGTAMGAQFNMVVENNTFKNLGQIFKLYTDDKMIGQPEVQLNLSGSNDATKNTFENVETLGEADAKATSMATSYSGEWSAESKQWTGIAAPKVLLAMDKIKMDIDGTLETGYLTLCNGTQVMTYTQAINPAQGRTGYWLKDEAGAKYWYFCTFNGNINYFFKDGTNDIYVAILGGGSDCTSLKVKELESEPNWVTDDTVNNSSTQKTYKYYDGVGTSKVGALYKSAFTIETYDGNTVYNGTVAQSGNKVTISARTESSDINLFISNINGCSKLLVTTDASATADSNTYVIVVPGAIGQLVVSGNCEVIVDVDIANITVLDAQSVTINAGKTVSGILKVSGTDAIGASLTNNGTIGKLYVFAKTTVVNNGEITTILVGNSLPGGVTAKLKTVVDAQNSIITNNGTIMSIHAITKITLTNNSTGSIDGLTIAFLDAGMEYAKGSIITNNGKMCNLAHGNINLYVQCAFTNAGIIGKEGRATGASANCKCENIGGCINIGYYGFSDAHDGLVFTNSGTIYAGARHNSAHQQYTFWVFGVKTGYGTIAPTVTVNNSGTILGQNWITDYDIAANHNVPTTYQAA